MTERALTTCVLSICLFLSNSSIGRAASTEQQDQKTAHDFYLSGNALYRAGEFGKAIAAFRKSIELNSRYYYARINLGVALANTGQFGEAVREFTFCIDKKWGSGQDRFVFHFNRSLALKSDGQASAAQNDRAALKELDPVRGARLQDSTEYILMDPAYMEKRNQSDMTGLFDRDRAAIMKGDIVIRRVADPVDNEQEYDVIGLIEGTVEQVSAVLADYKNYPKFMPNVKEIVIKSSSDGGTVVDHKLLFPMGFVKKYRLKFRLENEQNRSRLFWRKLPWAGLKDKETVVDTYGQWTIETLPGSDDKVLAYYRVYTDTGNVPFGTAWLVEPMTKKSFQDMFKGTRRRVKDVYD